MTDRLETALDVLALAPVEVTWGDVERRLGPSTSASGEDRPGPSPDLDLPSIADASPGGHGLRRRLPLLAAAACLLALVAVAVLAPAVRDQNSELPTAPAAPVDAPALPGVDDPGLEAPEPLLAPARPLLPPFREVAVPAIPFALVAAATGLVLVRRRTDLGADAPLRPARVGWLVGAGCGALAASAWLWSVTPPPGAVLPSVIVGSPPLEPGESAYVGNTPLADRDLVIESATPVTVNGLQVSLWMCDSGRAVRIGLVLEEEIDRHCASLTPFVPGSIIREPEPDQPSAPYLVVQVTATSREPQVLCGLDITSRTPGGWRTGRTTEGGPHRVVVNRDPDLEDSFDEPLLARCSIRE